MKKSIVKIANSLLDPLGLELHRKRADKAVAYQQVHDPASSFMLEDSLQNVLFNELTQIVNLTFEEFAISVDRDLFNAYNEVVHFWELYCNRPFDHNQGGSGFHNAFWIYLFARIFSPTLVVESGVWRGQTTWLLAQACPEAQIHGFDLNLSKLQYNGDIRVSFHEMDWSTFDFSVVDLQRALVFFDCHVNQAKRILQAADKGFRHLLFDDNPPSHKLYGYGNPGFPTASMVINGEDRFQEISWMWQGQACKYSFDPGELRAAQDLVSRHYVFPDVGGPTRYGGYSFLTYVLLR